MALSRWKEHRIGSLCVQEGKTTLSDFERHYLQANSVFDNKSTARLILFLVG